MVYTTFESINRRYGHIHESMEDIKKSMLEYLHDAVEEVGVMLVQHEGSVVHLASRIANKEEEKKHPFLIGKNMKEVWCSDLNFETCYDICKQVREMHLFKEWGDPEDEEPQATRPIDEGNSATT